MDITLMTTLAARTTGSRRWPLSPLLWLVVIVTVVWFFKRGRSGRAALRRPALTGRGTSSPSVRPGENPGEEYLERLEGLR